MIREFRLISTHKLPDQTHPGAAGEADGPRDAGEGEQGAAGEDAMDVEELP